MTVPVNEVDGVTVMVEVLPVVAPGPRRVAAVGKGGAGAAARRLPEVFTAGEQSGAGCSQQQPCEYSTFHCRSSFIDRSTGYPWSIRLGNCTEASCSQADSQCRFLGNPTTRRAESEFAQSGVIYFWKGARLDPGDASIPTHSGKDPKRTGAGLRNSGSNQRRRTLVGPVA